VAHTLAGQHARGSTTTSAAEPLNQMATRKRAPDESQQEPSPDCPRASRSQPSPHLKYSWLRNQDEQAVDQEVLLKTEASCEDALEQGCLVDPDR
jgi:hypothetical protein